MVPGYTSYTIWEKHIVVVLHIYRARAILILFCDHQDTESEWCEIEISVSQPIFAQKNQRLYGTRISIIYNVGGKYRDNYWYWWIYSHFSTILRSPRHWIRVTINRKWRFWKNINPEKILNTLWDINTHTLQNGIKILCWLLIYIELDPF